MGYNARCTCQQRQIDHHYTVLNWINANKVLEAMQAAILAYTAG